MDLPKEVINQDWRSVSRFDNSVHFYVSVNSLSRHRNAAFFQVNAVAFTLDDGKAEAISTFTHLVDPFHAVDEHKSHIDTGILKNWRNQKLPSTGEASMEATTRQLVLNDPSVKVDILLPNVQHLLLEFFKAHWRPSVKTGSLKLDRSYVWSRQSAVDLTILKTSFERTRKISLWPFDTAQEKCAMTLIDSYDHVVKFNSRLTRPSDGTLSRTKEDATHLSKVLEFISTLKKSAQPE